MGRHLTGSGFAARLSSRARLHGWSQADGLLTELLAPAGGRATIRADVVRPADELTS
jgi:hypothetical protein